MDEAIKNPASIHDKENLKNAQVLLMVGMDWGAGKGETLNFTTSRVDLVVVKNETKNNF